MRGRARPLVWVGLALSVAAAGCVSNKQAVTFSPCETVTGTATSYGRAFALRNAERSFRTQVPDARGELLNAGLRRVRPGPKRATCKPYRLFGGTTSLVTCSVQARVCGR
jgi:hypothetical protein